MKVASDTRWRATTIEQMRFGGKTVTKFRAMPTSDVKTWFFVVAYGRNPATRKSLAEEVAKIAFELGRAPGGCEIRATTAELQKWRGKRTAAEVARLKDRVQERLVSAKLEKNDEKRPADDYEPCGECGFDHHYEPEEALKSCLALKAVRTAGDYGKSIPGNNGPQLEDFEPCGKCGLPVLRTDERRRLESVPCKHCTTCNGEYAKIASE